MAFLFGGKKKTSPSDLCKQARDALALYNKDNEKAKAKVWVLSLVLNSLL